MLLLFRPSSVPSSQGALPNGHCSYYMWGRPCTVPISCFHPNLNVWDDVQENEEMTLAAILVSEVWKDTSGA